MSKPASSGRRPSARGKRGLGVAVAALLGATVTAGALSAQADAPAPAAQAAAPATIVGTRQVDFTSKINGHTYRIQVAMPVGPAPQGGFPVIYVLDGDNNFGAWTGAARLRAMGGELAPAVIVGIGYPETPAGLLDMLARRNYDLTQTDADAAGRAALGAIVADPSKLEFGGAETFFQVIQTEIKPRVAAIVPVAPGRDALFGHSLGGLFVVHALFAHPEAFHTWLALSPSIWWSEREVLKGEAAFEKQVAEGKVAPQVFIGVGGLEQTAPPPPYPGGLTADQVHAMLNASAMVDNAMGLAARLAAVKGAPGYRVQSRAFEGQTHTSVPWTAIDPLLDFTVPAKPAS